MHITSLDGGGPGVPAIGVGSRGTPLEPGSGDTLYGEMKDTQASAADPSLGEVSPWRNAGNQDGEPLESK